MKHQVSFSFGNPMYVVGAEDLSNHGYVCFVHHPKKGWYELTFALIGVRFFVVRAQPGLPKKDDLVALIQEVTLSEEQSSQESF